MTKKSTLFKIRHQSMKVAAKEHERLAKKLIPDSKQEDLELEIKSLQSTIKRCNSDLTYPMLMGNIAIINKRNVTLDRLKEKEDELVLLLKGLNEIEGIDEKK